MKVRVLIERAIPSARLKILIRISPRALALQSAEPTTTNSEAEPQFAREMIRVLNKDPHLRSSPILGEGKKGLRDSSLRSRMTQRKEGRDESMYTGEQAGAVEKLIAPVFYLREPGAGRGSTIWRPVGRTSSEQPNSESSRTRLTIASAISSG